MKRIIPFILIIFFAFGVFAQVGTLTVTNVESTPGTGVTVVDYEFSGQAGTYDISAEVSFDNGDTWENIPADDLTGAVTDVAPGGPYSITWDGMASFPETYSEETVIRLTATLVTAETFTLSMEADPAAGGTATDETDAGPYEENAVINIKAEPNPGFSFVNWTAPAGSFGNAGFMATTFTMPAQHVTVTANFEPIDYTLTLTADPTEGGSVEDVTDDAPYHMGEEVEIKAEANEGWAFVNWTDDDDGDTEVSTDATYIFDMPAANVNYTANFELIDYTVSLTANPAAGGNVAGEGTFNFGDEVQVDATPNTGWAFVNWTDDDDGDTEVSTDATYIFDMPAQHVTITANFCELPDAPVADDATGITINTFSANWDEVSGALNYTLDVALDEDFNTFVDGFENLNVGDATNYLVGGLDPTTTYYYRVSATDDCGTSEFYSNIISVYTAAVPFTTCGDKITFTYRGQTVIYGTVERDGLCWLDRNLGADPMPFVPADDATGNTDTRLYGDLFQWGRADEGHQLRGNTVHYSEQATTPEPNTGAAWDGKFIKNSSDWLLTQNDNLWQGGENDNNPCPPGWRVSNEAELDAERESWGVNNQNAAGAFEESTLKWPVGGYRSWGQGSLLEEDVGVVWSSNFDSTDNRYLFYSQTGANIRGSSRRTWGFSVRCVKTILPPVTK